SLAYLEQLFIKLRRAGLVESARGRAGGYRLGRAARLINVAEIMAAGEEGTRMTRCAGEDAPPWLPGQRCLAHALLGALGDHIAAFLRQVALQEVIDGIPAARQAPGRDAGRAGLDVSDGEGQAGQAPVPAPRAIPAPAQLRGGAK